MAFSSRFRAVLQGAAKIFPRERRKADPDPPLTASEQRDLVPAYFIPRIRENADSPINPDDEWVQMIRVIKPHSIVIMNPGSGPIGPDHEMVQYRYAIDLCHGRDDRVRVIGYVSTGRGAVPLPKAKEDVDEYRTRYPDLDGIFLDEMNNNADDEAVI